jgi:hypothetical protein
MPSLAHALAAGFIALLVTIDMALVWRTYLFYYR